MHIGVEISCNIRRIRGTKDSNGVDVSFGFYPFSGHYCFVSYISIKSTIIIWLTISKEDHDTLCIFPLSIVCAPIH